MANLRGVNAYYGDMLTPIAAKETVKSFYGIYGEEGNLTYREGWERIPENWYKTPVDYGLIQLNLDVVGFILKYPQLGR
jgi:hypothetical protein